jgi:NMD protein affecting ribosome stability and mRNA decay
MAETRPCGHPAGVRDTGNDPCMACMTEEYDDEPQTEHQPIGRCSHCGAPHYTTEGFCGGCEYGKH